jgi:hypothetical protein
MLLENHHPKDNNLLAPLLRKDAQNFPFYYFDVKPVTEIADLQSF